LTGCIFTFISFNAFIYFLWDFSLTHILFKVFCLVSSSLGTFLSSSC
jgi:hypothetical protein